MEMILIIYTTYDVIMATTLIIWRKSSNKKEKKDNTIERPIFWAVIKVLVLRDFRMRFNFITGTKYL